MDEKDILSKDLEMKFDNLIEDYVVVERRITNNIFRNIRTKQNLPPPFPNNLPPNMPPPPYPEFNYSVFLARRIYFQMVSSIEYYESLREQNPELSSTFNSLISQMDLLRITMYNIYRRLSGNNLIFGAPDRINITGTFCTDLVTTYDYVSSLSTNLFYLQRLVDIPDINRQLIIMLTTITGQLNTLNSLINENC